MFFMAYSPQPTVAVDTNTGAATQGSIRRKVGGRYAADLVLQLRARGRFRCFSLCIHRYGQAFDFFSGDRGLA
jgi:hypothetical protein